MDKERELPASEEGEQKYTDWGASSQLCELRGGWCCSLWFVLKVTPDELMASSSFSLLLPEAPLETAWEVS